MITNPEVVLPQYRGCISDGWARVQELEIFDSATAYRMVPVYTSAAPG